MSYRLLTTGGKVSQVTSSRKDWAFGKEVLISPSQCGRMLDVLQNFRFVLPEYHSHIIPLCHSAKPFTRPYSTHHSPTMSPSDVSFEVMFPVYESWMKIRAIPNYAEVAGEILFRRIFELAPAAIGLYKFGTGFSEVCEEMYCHPAFKAHSKGVVKMLDEAIQMLGPDMMPLILELETLGARHVEYGVLPAHYDIVGQALLYTLEAALGDGWNQKLKDGWIQIYGAVSGAMMEGAKRQIKKDEARKVTVNGSAQKCP
eukprot:Nitzschia sp. Nitz4//scaffold201_size42423//40844//41768//NITZ4_007381-RA/size42423-snap-gene-0.42-mRNA-1//-1//CDS//3329541353//9232//frame0